MSLQRRVSEAPVTQKDKGSELSCFLRPRKQLNAPRTFYPLAFFIALAWLAAAGPVWASPGPQTRAGWLLDMNLYSTSAHATLTCQQCHPKIDQEAMKHPEALGSDALKRDAIRNYDYRLCQTCHRSAFERCQKGAHAEALKKETEALAYPAPQTPDNAQAQQASGKTTYPAPVCGDCHEVHTEKGLRPRLDVGRAMVGVCGSCHPAELATYLDDYHGKTAFNLGREDSAFCTDCHGGHHVKSLKDESAALTACQRCHPDAGPRFAQFVIHPELSDADQQDGDKVFRVRAILFIGGLAAAVIGLMIFLYYGHTLAWMLREIHNHLRKH